MQRQYIVPIKREPDFVGREDPHSPPRLRSVPVQHNRLVREHQPWLIKMHDGETASK